MKESERLDEARKGTQAAALINLGKGNSAVATGLTIAAAVLEIARQIALTREQAGPLPIMAAIVATRQDHIIDAEEAASDAQAIFDQIQNPTD